MLEYIYPRNIILAYTTRYTYPLPLLPCKMMTSPSFTLRFTCAKIGCPGALLHPTSLSSNKVSPGIPKCNLCSVSMRKRTETLPTRRLDLKLPAESASLRHHASRTTLYTHYRTMFNSDTIFAENEKNNIDTHIVIRGALCPRRT